MSNLFEWLLEEFKEMFWLMPCNYRWEGEGNSRRIELMRGFVSVVGSLQKKKMRVTVIYK